MAVSAEVADAAAAAADADHAPRRQSRLDLIRRSIVVRGPAHCALLPHKGRRLFFSPNVSVTDFPIRAGLSL